MANQGGFPWKWVLIGCGSLLFLGLLFCGGCLGYMYYAGRELMQFASELERNSQIEAELGKFKVVQGRQEQVQNSDGSITQTFHLQGERGHGKVDLTYKFESMKLKILSKVFTNDKTGNSFKLE